MRKANSLDSREIEEIEGKIGYVFKNKSLIQQALTHSSAKENYLHCNERLEFLGDSILGHIVSEYLYSTYSNKREGELSLMKSILVSAKTFCNVMKWFELDEVIMVGRGLVDKKSLPSSLLSDAFESIVAAIYIDGGFEEAKNFTLKQLEKAFEEVDSNKHEKNYKSLLQDYGQKEYLTLPAYTVTKETGPDHSKTFQVIVELNGKSYGSALGSTKKEAEQGAAKLALEELGLIEPSKP